VSTSGGIENRWWLSKKGSGLKNRSSLSLLIPPCPSPSPQGCHNGWLGVEPVVWVLGNSWMMWLVVMVHAWSHYFQRTIIGWLRRSLRWWPPHHCSVPPLPPATLVRLISDLHRNSSSTPIPPTNLHSYHCHYQPAPCTIYHSTTRAPPCSTHVPCLRPIISLMHQFSGHGFRSPQGLARIWVSTLQHTLEYEPFCYMFHSATICSPKYLLICLCLYLYKYLSCSM